MANKQKAWRKQARTLGLKARASGRHITGARYGKVFRDVCRQFNDTRVRSAVVGRLPYPLLHKLLDRAGANAAIPG